MGNPQVWIPSLLFQVGMATKYERSWELDSTLEIHKSWISLWLIKVNNLNQKLVYLFSLGRSNVARKVSFVFDELFGNWNTACAWAMIQEPHYGCMATASGARNGPNHLPARMACGRVCFTTARTTTRTEWDSTFRGEALGISRLSLMRLEFEQREHHIMYWIMLNKLMWRVLSPGEADGAHHTPQLVGSWP